MGTVAAGSSTVVVVVGCADVVVEMIVVAVWVVVVTEAVDVDAGVVACTASVSRVRITSASSAAHAVMEQVQQSTRAHHKRVGRQARSWKLPGRIELV